MIKIIILVFLIILSTVYAEEGKYYDVNIHYDNEKVSGTAILMDGRYTIPDDSFYDDYVKYYSYRIISLEDKELFFGDFSISLFSSPFGILNSTDTKISLPYFDNAKEITIYNETYSKISSISLYHLSDPVKVKEKLQINTYAPKDNKCEKGVKDNFCDLDCSYEEDPDCYKIQKELVTERQEIKRDFIKIPDFKKLTYPFLGILGILVLVLLIYKFKDKFKGKPVSKREQQLKNFIEKAKDNNESKETIKNDLLKQGWPKDLIDKYL